MSGFIEGVDRDQVTLFPDRLEDWIDDDHSICEVGLFVSLIWQVLALRAASARTGRPGYQLAILLTRFIQGYLNRIPLSRRRERAARRDPAVMWMIGWMAPDHNTIADYRRHDGGTIRKTCALK